MAVHAADDFRFGGMRRAPQQADRAQNHARRAPAALHGVGLQERFLHGVQLAGRRQPFDGDDALAGHRAHLGDARFGRLPLHQHRAGGALALAAAVLGAGQVEIVAQDAEQRTVRIGIDFAPSCH